MAQTRWPTQAAIQLFGIELPILQAPMAGAQDADLAVAVCRAGGLGAIPCAMLSVEQARAEATRLRAATDRPFNMNFFCHEPPVPDLQREDAWRAALSPYYAELGIDLPTQTGAARKPYDDQLCALVEEVRPAVVSFHFGLPALPLLERTRATGARVIASATSVAEAVHLAQAGVDAVIAQGMEAGGHQGNFLESGADPVGIMALLPQIVDAVDVPVIAAGAMADGRGIAAAFALGAAGVQVGTAYLHTPQSRISAMHRARLAEARAGDSVLTNVFTGRRARGIRNRIIDEQGPISAAAPAFPLAAGAIGPLRATAEAAGSGDFSPLWSGQAGPLGRVLEAGELTRLLAREALDVMGSLCRGI